MQLVGEGFVLMQDNDAKHTSKLCQMYIKSKEEQQSADLNTIELGWDEIDRMLLTSGKSYIKVGRILFSLPPGFIEKSAENLRSSDSSQRVSFLWINCLRNLCVCARVRVCVLGIIFI